MIQQGYAQARQQARTTYQQSFETAYQQIAQGGTPEALDLSIRTHLGHQGQQALKRYFEQVNGLRSRETDPQHIHSLLGNGEETFQQAILPSVRPWISPTLYGVLTHTQSLMNSQSPREHMQGQQVWQVMTLAEQAARRAGARTGMAHDAFLLNSMAVAQRAFESRQPYTFSDVADAVVKTATMLRRTGALD